MCGQDQDGGVRERRADLAGGVQALSRVTRRHPDIRDDQVGPLLADELKEFGRVAALANHLEAPSFEQTRYSRA
jgi:hypothetical protein